MGKTGSSLRLKYRSYRTVEEAIALDVQPFRPYIRQIEKSTGHPGFHLKQTWVWVNRPTIGIWIKMSWAENGVQAWVSYTLPQEGDKPFMMNYRLRLATSLGFRKYRIWWWQCPLCGRRAGKLYLTPVSNWLGCRICHRLKYASQLESYHTPARVNLLAESIDHYPYLTPVELGKMLDCRLKMRRVPAAILDKVVVSRRNAWQKQSHLAQDSQNNPAYLTAENLCEAAGLSGDQLEQLAAACLLLPDKQDGLYRPKLAGWAKKLAYLLNEGWTLEEIKSWAKGRWSTGDPRTWPPERDDWNSPDR